MRLAHALAQLGGCASGVFPQLLEFDWEEYPRGFATAAASLASAGGLQINSPRLFAPELATGHQSWSGLQISHGAVRGVLHLVLIRRRKCICSDQVAFFTKSVLFWSWALSSLHSWIATMATDIAWGVTPRSGQKAKMRSLRPSWFFGKSRSFWVIWLLHPASTSSTRSWRC